MLRSRNFLSKGLTIVINKYFLLRDNVVFSIESDPEKKHYVMVNDWHIRIIIYGACEEKKFVLEMEHTQPVH